VRPFSERRPTEDAAVGRCSKSPKSSVPEVVLAGRLAAAYRSRDRYGRHLLHHLITRTAE
jgi:hypothetical protein